ncbi:MAG: hypothetical protein ACREP7_05160 [Lysobacter sp.]
MPVIAFPIVYTQANHELFRTNRFGMEILFVVIVVASIAQFAYMWTLADEVDDAADRLKLKRRGVDATVLLADVERVSKTWWSNPDRIVLHLRRPGPLGERVAFIPRGKGLGFGTSPVFADLKGRVEQARNSRAHRG